MYKTKRHWFILGQYNLMAVMMDFNMECPVAVVEHAVATEEASYLSPNQDSIFYKFIAKTNGQTKEFHYNPHNQEDKAKAIQCAIEWCESQVAPPVVFTANWLFYLKALMMWKYEAIWEDGKIVALRKKVSQK